MKLRSKFRMLGLLVLLVVAAFALLLILPFLKEGSSWSDIPLFLATAGVCLAAGAVWWMFSGFRLQRSILGLAVIAVPVVAHLLMVADLVFERFNGERQARKVAVSGYAEKPIVWPGFDGPIGLQLKLEVTHPQGLKGLIDPPEIRMGPAVDIAFEDLSATRTGGSGFFKDSYVKAKVGNLALLKAVLFQKTFANPEPADKIGTWNASSRFDPSGKTSLTYFLLPGVVDYLPAENRICLNARLEGLPVCGPGEKPEQGCASPNVTRLKDPVYAMGENLTVLWTAWPAMNISPALTRALREHSAFQGNADGWTAMQKRLEPSGLVAAGYDLCDAGKDSHTSSRLCFCRDAENGPVE